MAGDTRKKLEDLVNALDKVDRKVDGLLEVANQCQVKVEESGEKLETMRTGLADFAADVNAWVQAAEESEADNGTEGQSLSTTVALGTPDSRAEEIDLLRYVDQQGVGFDFE